MKRRFFLGAGIATLAAPAIVRASSLMQVRNPIWRLIEIDPFSFTATGLTIRDHAGSIVFHCGSIGYSIISGAQTISRVVARPTRDHVRGLQGCLSPSLILGIDPVHVL